MTSVFTVHAGINVVKFTLVLIAVSAWAAEIAPPSGFLRVDGALAALCACTAESIAQQDRAALMSVVISIFFPLQR